jgi:hypothetical protein
MLVLIVYADFFEKAHPRGHSYVQDNGEYEANEESEDFIG